MKEFVKTVIKMVLLHVRKKMNKLHDWHLHYNEVTYNEEGRHQEFAEKIIFRPA